jgi:nitroreductase
MVIAAWAQGVGTCWIGDFAEDEVKKWLRIPEKLSVIALVSFGYPAEQPTEHDKKALSEIIHHDKF